VVSQDFIHFVKKISIWRQQIICMSRTSLLQNSAHIEHQTIYEQYNFHFLLPFIDIWFCDCPGFSTLWAAQSRLQFPTGAWDSSLLHTIDSESQIYPAPHSSVDTSDYSTHAFMACIGTTLHVPQVFQTVPH